jgi:outer membrane receptor protein involved in Fe transport
VEITANKKLIERKVDRLVFNVENSVSAAGGDAIDALKVTPGLRVQNDQISIIGKSGVSVMVDDRILQLSGDDLTNYLKSIPSDNIKSIEVITAPPAKYDAEGNSGLVNIVTKKTKKDSWNAYLSGAFTQFKYARFNESAGFKYNKNKLSLYADVSHNDGVSSYRSENGTIHYPDKLYNSFSKIKSDYGANISINTGLDYDFSQKFSMGFQYMHNYGKSSSTDNNDTKIYAIPNNLIQTFTNSEGSNKRNNLNFHSTYKLDSLGGKIDLNLDYFDYNTNRDRIFQTKEYENFTDYTAGSFVSANNGSQMGIKNYSAKIDVEQPLNCFKLSYGGRLSFTENNSSVYYYDLTSGIPIFQPNRSDDFVYDENLQALYISGNKKFGKWEIQAGLRMENTQTKGTSKTLNETHKNDYSKLFPTLYAVYSPNENNSFSFNYSKRISRPGFSLLNPFVRYINPYSTSQGNPFLQPYFTDNFELTYNFKNNWANTLFVSNAKNIYEQVEYISADNINTATKDENFYDELSFGITSDYTFHLLKNWESNISAYVYYKNIKSSLPQTLPSFKGWSAFLETENNYTINKQKTVSLALNCWYQFPEYYAIYDTKGYWSMDFGIRTLFLDKKLTIALYASDIFRTLKIKNTSIFNNIVNDFENYEYRQSIRLSLRYAFGNRNISGKNIKSSNEEEKRRAN